MSQVTRLLANEIAAHLECHDCGVNLHRTGPYIGAVVRVRQGVYAFLCHSCARINLMQYQIERMSS